VDHIWERVFSIEDPKLNRYVQSSDEFSQVMSQSLLQQHHHHYSLPEPFLLQQMKHVRGKTNSNENQQMIVERLQCPPDAKPGEKVNFTFCGKVYKYTVPSNVPKNRMIDVHFPIFSTSKKKIKKVKAKKLRRSKRVPLGPPPSRQDFIDFMIARESLRINKMNHHEDPSKWTDDSVLREYKFTNVKREHDRTTIAFRKITDSRKPLFREISSLASRPRTSLYFVLTYSQLARSLTHSLTHSNLPGKRHQKDDDESWKKEIYEREIKEAGLMVFNCCVQRQFGTTIFAQAMGYFTEWGPETIDRVAKKCIDLLFEKGKLMFSGAYMPQSIYRNAEKRAMFHNNPELAIRWYREMCKRLTNVWNIRDKIARLARETKSWETVVKCLAKCPWFGGSMFHSKEAVQDMIHTFVFQRPNEDGKTWTCECIDLDSFCPIGPGARRGLNRLAGRATSHAVERTKSEQVSIFYKEAMSLFEEVKTKWPGTILNVKVERLHLHDIQFQLCEFDKYQRVKSGYMKGKRYKHCSEENEIAEREDSEAASIYRERTKKVQDLKKRKRQKLEAEKMMKKKLISNSDELLMVTPKKRRHYVSRVISPTFKSRLEQDAVAHILSPLEQQKTGAVVVS